jgi:hypothetical protein
MRSVIKQPPTVHITIKPHYYDKDYLNYLFNRRFKYPISFVYAILIFEAFSLEYLSLFLSAGSQQYGKRYRFEVPSNLSLRPDDALYHFGQRLRLFGFRSQGRLI